MNNRATVASVAALAWRSLGMTEEEGIALLFDITAGLEAMRRADGQPHVDFERMVTEANVEEHLEDWQVAAIIGGRE